MSKIIRTPTRAEGGITPEEKARMDVIAQKWINVAMRTDPIELDKIGPAVRALYAAAGKECKRVIVVPSPLVMAFAYGAASWIWHCRNKSTRAATVAATYDATDDATRDATDDATYAATRAATYAATRAATDAATDAATYDATDAATYDATDAATVAATYDATDAATVAATYDATDAATRAATYAATRAATDDATDAATYAATYDATDAATDAATVAATDAATVAATFSPEKQAAAACADLAGKGGIMCAQRWYSPYQGGNMWAGWAAYLEACREVLGLQLPQFEKYQAWEDCALHGGFRVLHEEFCIVSDFPAEIHKDDRNLPHNERGPSHRWRDGWELYHWHGVKVPKEWIMDKAITAKEALTWPNIEQRRAACEILGWSAILKELDSKVIDEDSDPEIGTLIEANIPDSGKERFLRVRCGTGRDNIVLPVPPDMKTALQANLWTYGIEDVNRMYMPEVRT